MMFVRALKAATGCSVTRSLFWYLYSVEIRVAVKIYHIVYTKGKYSKYLSERLRARYGVVCGPNAIIGSGLKVAHHSGIVIGDGAIIGDNCTVYHQVTIGQSRGQYPIIGNDVTLWSKSTVVGDVHVGDGAQIGTCALVFHDVPDGAIIKGGEPW